LTGVEFGGRLRKFLMLGPMAMQTVEFTHKILFYFIVYRFQFLLMNFWGPKVIWRGFELSSVENRDVCNKSNGFFWV
jgi:hypothetical protein